MNMNETYRLPIASTLDLQLNILHSAQSEPHGILRQDRNVVSSDNNRLDIDAIMRPAREIEAMRKARAIVSTFQEISSLTGGYVQVLPEYAHCPVLIGADHKPIPLADIVEAIDEFVDYEALRADYPSLSYAQIDGAVSFLRKLVQLNDKLIDFDAPEDRELAADADLIAALRESLNDREMARVLGNDQ